MTRPPGPGPGAVAVFAVPLRTRFRGLTAREGVLVRGHAGWGEFSPFTEYDDRTAAPWLRAAWEAAAGDWPAPVRTAVPVNVTVPACDPERAHAIVLAGGCATAKVKVAERGQTLADDVARVEAVRDALDRLQADAGRPPGDAHLRVDANGGWDLDGSARAVGAVAAIAALDRAARGLEYVEQPVADVEDLARVRRRVAVPVAADESIRRAADPYRVRDLGAADIAVLKVQPLGGVRACLRIAEDIGLPVVVSSAVESSVGTAAGVALAAALPDLPHACGLATLQLLDGDVTAGPLLPTDGVLSVADALAVRPDPDALAAVAAPPDRVRWWQDRLASVAALLAPGPGPEAVR